jgi:predicted dehydrogenase
MRRAKGFTDLDRFLSYGLDAVIIASPLWLHAEQSIAVLERGISVLSEVTPVSTLTQAAQLAAAVERTNGFYMLAENYRFIDDIELIKRMVDDGRFGRVSFGEGEYLHDCRDLALNSDGTPTWRGDLKNLGVLYCTHSLMPLLYITGDRVATVCCLGADDGIGGTLTLMKSAAGRVFKVRLDNSSPRPHNMAYYTLQGEAGAYESWRGMGDRAKVWLADVHEPSKVRALDGEVIAQWHPLSEFAAEYIPERVAAPHVARSSDHFGADYWMLIAFARALLDGTPSPIDVYQALDCSVPGIVALASRANGGAPVPVPDFRPPDHARQAASTESAPVSLAVR